MTTYALWYKHAPGHYRAVHFGQTLDVHRLKGLEWSPKIEGAALDPTRLLRDAKVTLETLARQRWEETVEDAQ